MFITIINDCRDENTMGRQATRAMQLFGNGISIATVGIGWSELEGAGNVIDMLDAASGEEGIIMVNVAPRHGRGKKWPNGTPFGYFRYKKTLIIATIAEQCLSLVKKFGITDSIAVTDVPTVVDKMIKRGRLDTSLRDRIAKSQFRSFDYMPRLAKWLYDGEEIPHEEYAIKDVEDAPKAVWWVDNFGNCKTTLLPEDIGHQDRKKLQTKFGEITCYTHLKDVPNGEAGLTIGSSGLDDKRFVELVVQGASAAKKFDLAPGDEIL
jgi:SAM hydroxide adenosyltransferase C-terminal domain